MKKMLIGCCLAVSFSAFAQGAPAPKSAAPAAAGAPAPVNAAPPAAGAPAPAAAAAAMDMSKMGAPSRKPTDEKKTKKEIEAFMKASEAAEAKNDEAAKLAMIDFPVFMATDDSKGVTEGELVNREQYIEMMKPFGEMPKDLKFTHKPTISVLTDSLAIVVDDFTMTVGKTKTAGRNASLLAKVAGNWKWKSMIEGGWGGSMAGSAKPATASAPAAGTPTPANPTVSPAAKTPATSGAPAAKNPATPAAGAPAPTGASAPPPAKK